MTCTSGICVHKGVNVVLCYINVCSEIDLLVCRVGHWFLPVFADIFYHIARSPVDVTPHHHHHHHHHHSKKVLASNISTVMYPYDMKYV